MKRLVACGILMAGWLASAAAQTQTQPPTSAPERPDTVFFNGKVVTVDGSFAVREAFAVRGGRIVAVGTSPEMLALAAHPATRRHNLEGRTVLPGLIDSHVHAPAAAVFEFDHPIPDMETIQDVLDYVAARAKVVPEGKWIRVEQVFITRLKEARYPTRAELDAVAPKHPVSYRTGPDIMLNTVAMKLCGFDRSFTVRDGGAGYLEKDPQGEPTGLTRGMARYVPNLDAGRAPTDAEQRERLRALFANYNATGITAVADRGATPESVAHYATMRRDGELTVRVALSQTFPVVGSMASILGAIDEIAASPLRREDPWLRLIGTKIWLDGGMLTGSAYMLKPWGRNENYGIRDDAYRGVLNVLPDRLRQMVRRVAEHGMQFTAHSVGDGAITELVKVYDELNRERPVRDLRMSLTHANFMTKETVEAAARLGLVIDLQPIWLFLDTRTLVQQFGYERLQYFQPLKTLLASGAHIGGGSDHMLKIGDMRAINPYNPFHAMWVTQTRRAKWYEGQLHPEEALTRRQAIEFYTRGNAYVIFREKDLGSLEVGKLADFIVVDRDVLACTDEELRDAKVEETWLAGAKVFELQPKRE